MKIFELTDNSNTYYTFRPSRINRVEYLGFNVRIALNNEIVRLSYDTEEEAKSTYNKVQSIMEQAEVEYTSEDVLVHTLYGSKQNS